MRKNFKLFSETKKAHSQYKVLHFSFPVSIELLNNC